MRNADNTERVRSHNRKASGKFSEDAAAAAEEAAGGLPGDCRGPMQSR